MVGRRDAGFTLVELLVVLLVIGLVTALATPAFHRSLPGFELRAAAREAAAVLHRARDTAIRQGREVAVTFDLTGRRYWIDRKPPVALAPGIELAVYTARSEVPESQVGRIRFYPDGSSTGGRLTLRADRASYALDVDWLTGNVRIQD